MESARLRGWFDELAAGRGRAVLIRGEPGVGKTALLQAALDYGSSLGCRVLRGESDELGERFPLRPFLDALSLHGGRTEQRRAAIVEVVGMPESESSATSWPDPVLVAVQRLLERVDDACAAEPTVLAIDDLHWADTVTVHAWDQLARTARQEPLLILGTLRPVPRRRDLDALRRGVEEHGHLVDLRPLPAAEVTKLVGALAGGEPSATLLRLAAGAGGNPLYLTELVDAISREGRLTVSGGAAEVVGGMPPSLAGAIRNRLAFLPPATRTMLQTAALLGTTFTASDLATLTGAPATALVDALLEARSAGTLDDAGSSLSFRHELIWDALYTDIPLVERHARHRDAARRLAGSGAAADQVARQLLRAGDTADEWTRDWLVSAAPRLIGQTATVAVELLQRTLDGTPAGHDRWGALTAASARALFWANRLDDAEAQARAAIEGCGDPELLAELHWIVVSCLTEAGRWKDVPAAANRVLLAPGLSRRWAVRFLSQVAAAACAAQPVDLRAADAAVNRALAAAEAVGDPLALGWALHAAAYCQGLQGEDLAALRYMRRALDVLGDDPAFLTLRLRLLRNVAVEMAAVDRLDEARRAAQESRRLAEVAGLRPLGSARSALADVEYYSGHWDDALAEIDLEERFDSDTLVTMAGIAALVAVHRDEPATVEAALRVADQHIGRAEGSMAGYLILARALAAERDGRVEQALAVLTDYLHSKPAIGLDYCGWDAVRLAVAVADRPTARRLTEQTESYATATGTASRQGMALYCRGLMDANAAPLVEAAEIYRHIGRPLLTAMAMEAAGGLLAEHGDVPAARRAFGEAIDSYAALAASADESRVRRRMHEFGIRRRSRVVRRPVSGVASLTPTERRVAHLLADGLPNPEIANLLFLSRRTVEVHVSNILRKLGRSSRVQVVAELAGSPVPADRD